MRQTDAQDVFSVGLDQRNLVLAKPLTVSLIKTCSDTERGGSHSEAKTLGSRATPGNKVCSPEEFESFLGAVRPEWLPWLVLGGLAGIRTDGEIFRIRWECFKWDRRIIDLDPAITKINERRHVPLCDRLIDLLKPIHRESGPVINLKKPEDETERLARVTLKDRAMESTPVSRASFATRCGGIRLQSCRRIVNLDVVGLVCLFFISVE
jgi:integrase